MRVTILLCSFAHLLLLATTAPVQENSTEPVCPSGCECGQRNIRCTGVDFEDILHFLLPSVRLLHLTDCDISELPVELLRNATNLEQLHLIDCGIESILLPSSGTFEGLRQLRSINLSQNELIDFAATMEAMQRIGPNVASIDLSANAIAVVNSSGDGYYSSVRTLNLSGNAIDTLLALPRSLQVVDLSQNEIANLSAVIWPPSLTHLTLRQNAISELGDDELLSLSTLLQLDASRNLITEIHANAFDHLPSLRQLDLSFNPLLKFDARFTGMRRLERLELTYTNLFYFDVDLLSAAMSLRSLNISHNRQLSSIVGQVGRSMEVFDMSHCDLRMLPDRFFVGASRLRQLLIDGNGWLCDYCVRRWHQRLPSDSFPPICVNSSGDASQETGLSTNDCLVGAYIPEGQIVRAIYSTSAVLHCNQYGQPAPSLKWFVYPASTGAPVILIGSYEPKTKKGSLAPDMDAKYDILPGGVLLIRSTSRDVVERYKCVVENEHGNSSAVIRFRLDLSSWYRLTPNPFDSVFIGSVVCGILTAFLSFIVNILWLGVRKVVLWYIHRAERTSRVRKMVEAMEKYRQKQLYNLHEKYNKRLGHIRDNYHQQVEQMRTSYTSQSERFRDYRVAQMETMNQHLDTIRDNYNQQIGRMREYGSRRSDQLWESYERQMNRIRTFSLQQRLRMMRQYKIKQRYLNKLLESLNADGNQFEMSRQDSEAVTAAMLAALDEANDLPPLGKISAHDSHMNISAASSYYSLPELFLDENGAIATVRSDSHSSSAASSSVNNTHLPPRQSGSNGEQSTSSDRSSKVTRNANIDETVEL
uniref:Ig-like domain-containing protein n=1 Tax=Plectus sambesii TaxID=2011161 RepID=A0A914WPT8_9BILA